MTAEPQKDRGTPNPLTDATVRDLAYRVRTSQLRFVDVPEDQRKAVAFALAKISDAEFGQIAESRRFPRGSGFGSRETTRVR